jgi:hypothetical protein
MKKLVVMVMLVLVVAAALPAPAHAGAAGDAVLALFAFGLFSALVAPVLAPPVYVARPPVYAEPAPVYGSAPAYYSRPSPAPAAAVSREVVYPHGRYVLYGDGIATAYRWVWVPNPPPPGSAPDR